TACSGPHHALRSFPTRRSSDLLAALFRLGARRGHFQRVQGAAGIAAGMAHDVVEEGVRGAQAAPPQAALLVGQRALQELAQFERSEEHTSELQSPYDLVCRLLL